MITIGIDPGARYTAVLVRSGDTVLLSSTYVRPLDMGAVTWAVTVAGYIATDVLPLYPDAPVGVEGISDPTGFKGGKTASINPKSIIRTGIVLGAIAEAFKSRGIVVVAPKKNGAGPEEDYPSVLNGRRPSDLPGVSVAGTRRHEKSAYDIAGEVILLISEGYFLDERLDFD